MKNYGWEIEAVVEALRGEPYWKERAALAFFKSLGTRSSGASLRTFRKLLAEDGRVCSCEKGLYIPATAEDLEAFRIYLRKKALALFDRYKRTAAAYPELAPGHEQLELRF